MRCYDRQGQPISFEQMARLFADGDYQVIEQTYVGLYWISTVWLGLDHQHEPGQPPLIFETMVFPASEVDGEIEYLDIDCRRYTTEAEARAGHQETVLLVRATTIDVTPDADCSHDR